MIRDFKKVDLLKIELGSLSLENCSGRYVDPNPANYPMAWFARKTKTGATGFFAPGNPEDCPTGYKIREQFDSPMEALLDHAENIKKEHANLPDDKMRERSPFNGRGRNARWEDEAMRRGLR